MVLGRMRELQFVCDAGCWKGLCWVGASCTCRWLGLRWFTGPCGVASTCCCWLIQSASLERFASLLFGQLGWWRRLTDLAGLFLVRCSIFGILTSSTFSPVPRMIKILLAGFGTTLMFVLLERWSAAAEAAFLRHNKLAGGFQPVGIVCCSWCALWRGSSRGCCEKR